MNRRGLLGAILAAATAPAIVKAGILMPVRKIITPPARTLWVTGGGGFLPGDMITIAGITGADGMLKQFRVTSTASGVLTLGGF